MIALNELRKAKIKKQQEEVQCGEVSRKIILNLDMHLMIILFVIYLE